MITQSGGLRVACALVSIHSTQNRYDIRMTTTTHVVVLLEWFCTDFEVIQIVLMFKHGVMHKQSSGI